MAQTVQSFSVTGGDQSDRSWAATLTVETSAGDTVTLSFSETQLSQLNLDLQNVSAQAPSWMPSEPPGAAPGDPIIGYD